MFLRNVLSSLFIVRSELSEVKSFKELYLLSKLFAIDIEDRLADLFLLLSSVILKFLCK